MTPDEFGERVKQKYPQYRDMPNDELSRRIVEKHPEYAGQVDLGSLAPSKDTNAINQSKELKRIAYPLAVLTDPGLRSRLAEGFLQRPNPPGSTPAENLFYHIGAEGPAMIASMATVNPEAGLAVRAGQAALAAGGTRLGQEILGQHGPLDAVKSAVTAAAGYATGEAAVGLALKTGGKTIPAIAQAMRAGSGVKKAEVALGSLEDFVGAKSPEIVSQSYEAFERYSGLKNLASQEAEQEAQFSIPQLFQMVTSTAKKLAAGNHVDAQTLYTASQAASRLKLMAKYGEPTAASAAQAGIVTQGKQMADKALSELLPEYSSLRKDYLFSRAAEEFSHVLPQNRHQSPNVLRSFAAVASGVRGASEGSIGLMAAPFAVSPWVNGMALRAAYIASKGQTILKPAAQVGLAQQYRRMSQEPRPSTP